MKFRTMALIAASLLVAGTVSAAPQKVRISPFSDNVVVNFSGFSTDSMVYASYNDDNGVSIFGPEIIKVSSPALVTISSKNLYENGNPSMTLAYNGTSCEIDFVDGPFAKALAYKTGMAPTCTGIVVSDILQTGQYSYAITVTPSGSNG